MNESHPKEVFRWRDFRYVYSPGGPMGRRLVHPYIRCLATEETQAGNTHDVIHTNLAEGPLGEGLPADSVGLTRILLPDWRRDRSQHSQFVREGRWW
jgi:hypothetical protein